jgi:hypothetical protein
MLSWKKPEMVEIKMDAEISSYQEDHDPMKDGPLFIEGQTGQAQSSDSKTA